MRYNFFFTTTALTLLLFLGSFYLRFIHQSAVSDVNNPQRYTSRVDEVFYPKGSKHIPQTRDIWEWIRKNIPPKYDETTINDKFVLNEETHRNEYTRKSAIIPLGNKQTDEQRYYAYRHIFRNLKRYHSNFIVYPYAFNYTFLNQTLNATQVAEYDEGAVFSTKPDEIPTEGQSTYFNHLKTNSTIEFGRAKALYDIHIAVLRVEAEYEGSIQDLTFESDTYCTVMASHLGKYTQCLSAKDFLNYTSDPLNSATRMVYVTPQDIRENILLSAKSNIPVFGILIIPDIALGSEQIIINQLGQQGIDKIKQFTSKGGNLYLGGKSVILLEHFGMIKKGLVDTSHLLVSKNQYVYVTGCEDASKTESSGGGYLDFVKSMLCFSLPKWGTKIPNYLLSSFLMKKNTLTEEPSLKPMLYFEANSDLQKRDSNTGLPDELSEDEKSFLPMTLYKQYDKGNIIVHMGHPTFLSSFYYPFFYNTLFLSMSKPMMLDTSVGFGEDELPIPGGEENVVLDLDLELFNLYETPLQNVKISVWLPNKVNTLSITPAAKCALVSTLPPPTQSLNSEYWQCTFPTVEGFQKEVVSIKIEISDYTVTQQQWNILIMYPIVEYTSGRTGKYEYFDQGGVLVNAKLAALLRGELNPDPSSFYPIYGRGQYVDNVLPVENKEDTDAYEVEYIGVVPIVSPVVDGSDQVSTIQTVTFWDKYYRKEVNGIEDYRFPFRNLRDYDFLDYKFLSGKGVVLGVDWDTAVKNFKVLRNSTFPTIDDDVTLDILGVNYSSTIDNLNMVTQQVHFADSDKFFEHATQRQLVFLDTTTPEGAETYYPEGIPDGIRNPNKPQVTKKELMWVRNDVFFYKDYELPENVNISYVFTIDRYPRYSGPCVEVWGDARSTKMVEGYFEDTQPGGLKAHEYSNELLMYCNRVAINYTHAEALTNGSVKAIRYLVPVADPFIQEASDIMRFDEVTGELEGYPEVKFIKGYAASFLLHPHKSRKGGVLVLKLPEGMRFKDQKDPAEHSLVAYSTDHVAFYKTVFNDTTGEIYCYFKRGLMPNEAYGNPSPISIMFEDLDAEGAAWFPMTMDLYELKYDLSAKELNYERYFYREEITLNVTRERFFSLPALQITVRMRKNSLQGYEYMEPFARYGVYIQELEKHRTIWGADQIMLITDPGLVAKNGGFATISNIGTSSIPFRHFLTVGKSQLIPSSSQTSRIQWRDIWGRQWVQPLRSVFPDVPPIPPPLRNFMMTTTFEMTKPDTGERVLEWISDETVDVRVQLKLLNNYPKYFQLTTCKDNAVYFYEKDPLNERIFESPPYPQEITSTTPEKDEYINLGNRAHYGICYTKDLENVVVSGQSVTPEQAELIGQAYHCSDKLNSEEAINCTEALKDIPTISRRKTTPPLIWNYSPQVEDFYPAGYIKDNMWDMTHYDYDDNAFDKAYKYHMDNNLPSLDNRIYKPHNIITQPIFKGFGYLIEYNQSYSVKRFPGKKGWWSDNLQNKDDTLLAGNAISNDVSVDKETLIPDSEWIQIDELKNAPDGAIENRLKNIYVCLFNRHRVKMTPESTKTYYQKNVYQNNVVPVIPDLTANDQRLTNFDCYGSGLAQYSPTNISLVDNRVYTNNARDWLYFAANLRGGAKETININYKLSPFQSVKYEGFAKVADGARFVYWNPANGPNSFLIVDNQVNVVKAKRSDVTVEVELFPKDTTTFLSDVYQLISIQDENEINREFTSAFYNNHYGFGDSTVSVYVGGTQGTKAILQPGESTLVKVTFYNNAGFDWNLLGSGIEFETLGMEPINANDLLYRHKHAIQAPLKYNFMILDIPQDIEPYVTMIPSDHNIQVAPLFFDFQNINVASIRDGYKADYFYKLTLSADIPETLRGRIWEIKISLNESCFDKLPGYNDPTKPGFHDYKLQIPNVVFGIPFGSGKYAGKVFYTSGFATDLRFDHWLLEGYVAHEAKFITEDQINQLRQIVSEQDYLKSELSKFFEETLGSATKVPFIELPETSGKHRLVRMDLSSFFPQFPKPNVGEPATAKFHIFMKTSAYQIPAGTHVISNQPKVVYIDESQKEKTSLVPSPTYRTVYAKGAWITVDYTGTVLTEDEDGNYVPSIDQRFFPEDSGIVEIIVKTENVGSQVAYHVNFTLYVSPGIEIWEEKLKGIPYSIERTKNGTSILRITSNTNLSPRTPQAERVYLKFYPLIQISKLKNTLNNYYPDHPAERDFIQGVSVEMDITASSGEIKVVQSIPTKFTIKYILRERETVDLVGQQVQGGDLPPIVNLTAYATPSTTFTGHPIIYQFFRKIWAPVRDYTNGTNGSQIPQWVKFSESNDSHVLDQPIPEHEYNSTVKIVSIEYRVQTLDENREFLAANQWIYYNEYPTHRYWIYTLIAVPVCIAIVIVVIVIIYVTTRRYRKREREVKTPIEESKNTYVIPEKIPVNPPQNIELSDVGTSAESTVIPTPKKKQKKIIKGPKSAYKYEKNVRIQVYDTKTKKWVRR